MNKRIFVLKQNIRFFCILLELIGNNCIFVAEKVDKTAVIMAELHLYKCKKCGWEVEAPSESTDMLMDSIMACYVCHDCQHVFKKYYALGTVFNGKVSCPPMQRL